MDWINHMLNKVNTTELFTVTYKKDKFIINNKEYPIGYTSYLVMNEDCRFIDIKDFEDLKTFAEELSKNDFDRNRFLEYHNRINQAIDVLSQYEVFKLIGIEEYKKKLDNLFTEDKIKSYEEDNQLEQNGYKIENFEKLDELIKVNIELKNAYKVGLFIFSSVQELVRYSCAVFQLTNKIVKNNARTKNKLAEAFNDFLNDPYMSFLFMDEPFSTRATITPVVETENGISTIYRRAYYSNLKDFLMTDLFEGYINGHYLWRCDICDRHFFMTTAHNQLYCSVPNPKYGVPCSYVAKHPEITKRKMKKQRKSDSPYYILWHKRNCSIRKNKSLGKYNEAVSAKAKKLIDDKFERAQFDFDYAENQYAEDMKLENIYKEAMK